MDLTQDHENLSGFRRSDDAESSEPEATTTSTEDLEESLTQSLEETLS